MVTKANFQKGQKIFIHAGSGVEGTLAIQFANHVGTFLATTTSRSNAKIVKNLGTEIMID